MSYTQYAIWKEEYSVGIETLDSQHKKILKMLNRLYSAIHEGSQSHLLGRILLELSEYTKTHFLDEESIMQECNYPECEQQKKAHKEMTLKTQDISMLYQRTSGDFSLDTLQFIKDWWVNHIIIMDQKYKPFLKV